VLKLWLSAVLIDLNLIVEAIRAERIRITDHADEEAVVDGVSNRANPQRHWRWRNHRAESGRQTISELSDL
jgi:hypothetical protein